MFRITVDTTRRAMLCLAAACFAGQAQADITGASAVPVAVSDALLAGTRAANLQPSIVANLSGAAPAAISPVNTTSLASNGVRLWDEVIPPAPAPQPTQASMTSHDQPRTIGTASRIQTMSLKVNASGARMASGIGR